MREIDEVGFDPDTGRFDVRLVAGARIERSRILEVVDGVAKAREQPFVVRWEQPATPQRVDLHRGVPFSLPTFRGTYDFADVLGKGPVVLTFFASWCEPCLDEAPHLARLYRKYDAQGLQMVAVSVDVTEDHAKLRGIVGKLDLPYPVALDAKREVIAQYSARTSIPLTLVMDASGMVVYRSTNFRPGDEVALTQAVAEVMQSGTTVADGRYLDRELATTMSHLGADWLTRSERDLEESSTLMHAQLGLSPGDVACDIGAGNGYHTLRMAAAVAPGGKVVAVDLQPEMLSLLRERAAKAGVKNVETVLADPDDPHLPPGTCDVALLVDVYHELSDPPAVLAHLARALTPGGRIALLEFRAEDPEVPIKALHKMSKEQILREYTANRLELVEEFDGLSWQHMMFFAPRR